MAYYNEDCIHQLCVITHHKNYIVFADDTSFLLFTLDRSVDEVVDVNDYVRVLYNPAGALKGKDVAFDNGDIVSGVSNCVVLDKEKCIDVNDEYVVVTPPN